MQTEMFFLTFYRIKSVVEEHLKRKKDSEENVKSFQCLFGFNTFFHLLSFYVGAFFLPSLFFILCLHEKTYGFEHTVISYFYVLFVILCHHFKIDVLLCFSKCLNRKIRAKWGFESKYWKRNKSEWEARLFYISIKKVKNEKNVIKISKVMQWSNEINNQSSEDELIK